MALACASQVQGPNLINPPNTPLTTLPRQQLTTSPVADLLIEMEIGIDCCIGDAKETTLQIVAWTRIGAEPAGRPVVRRGASYDPDPTAEQEGKRRDRWHVVLGGAPALWQERPLDVFGKDPLAMNGGACHIVRMCTLKASSLRHGGCPPPNEASV